MIRANDLNSQPLAFVFTVNIASGDISETCGDHDLPKNQQINWLPQLGNIVAFRTPKAGTRRFCRSGK